MKKNYFVKFIVLALIVTLTLQCIQPATCAYTAAGLNVYYINVDHGDCILLQQGDEYALVDTGHSDQWDKVKNFLTRKKVTELKYLIITHIDGDHFGNVTKLFDLVTVKNIVYREYDKDDRNELSKKSVIEDTDLLKLSIDYIINEVKKISEKYDTTGLKKISEIKDTKKLELSKTKVKEQINKISKLKYKQKTDLNKKYQDKVNDLVDRKKYCKYYLNNYDRLIKLINNSNTTTAKNTNAMMLRKRVR